MRLAMREAAARRSQPTVASLRAWHRPLVIRVTAPVGWRYQCNEARHKTALSQAPQFTREARFIGRNKACNWSIHLPKIGCATE
jgi:hypothetical protein